MSTVAEVRAVAINVQTLTDYVSANAAASVVILDTHFPPYRPQPLPPAGVPAR